MRETEKKKKLVLINSIGTRSTGKILNGLADEAIKQNYDVHIFLGRGKKNNNTNTMIVDSKIEFLLHVLLARIGFNGYGSFFATKRLIRKLKKINPDIIHLHNIHGYYLNLKVLFNYLKKDFKGKLIWTLHDCWAFTGHCSYFTIADCNKWQKECYKCKQLNCYPKVIIDTSRREYNLKKDLFVGVNDLTLVTPSLWLSKLVKMSFLNKYNVKVVNNGIDLNIFKKYDKKELNEIYEKYNISKNKYIILGVASLFGKAKGIFDFIELSNSIDKNKYEILLVGKFSKELKEKLNNINIINSVENQIELAKIYNIANVFINPTYEDNYPTVNLESIACGTPVITYNTGGSPESMLGFGIVTDKTELLTNTNNLLEKISEIKVGNSISNYRAILDYMKIYNGGD